MTYAKLGRRASVVALAVTAMLLHVSRAGAQVNGTWNVDISTNWSVTGSWLGGTVPAAGGTATFNMAYGQQAGRTVTNDVVGLTLGTIEFDSAYNYTIAAGAGTIAMGASGLTINSISSSFTPPLVNLSLGSTLTTQISGNGNLVKTGAGTVTLNGVTNNFIGFVQINQGILAVTSGSNGVFGDAANQVTLNGGILLTSTNTLTLTRQVNVGAGGGTIRTNTNTTLSGLLSGSGALTKQYGSTLFLQGDSSSAVTGFTGALSVQNGILTLQNAGRIAAGTDVDVAATLTFDNAGTNVANRLSGRGVVSRGSAVILTGNATAATSETLGTLTLAQGNSSVTVTPNAANPATLDFAGLTRQNNAVVLFRGTGLGGTPGNGVATITFQTSPGTLVGAGGDPTASTTASILPFAYGNVGAASTNDSSFVTWDATSKRIVPLSLSTGYATNITTATANDNVNQNATAAVAGGGTTINSLRMAPAASMTLSGGPITVTSGAILVTSTAATVPLTTISSSVVAPSGRELVLVSTNGTTFDAGTLGLSLSGVIQGNAGLTKSGNGAVTITNVANTYTGPTTLSGGILNLGAGTVSNDGTPSLLGQSTLPLVLGGSAGANRLYALGPVTINRDITAIVGHNSTLAIGMPGVAPGESMTINGNVAVTNPTGSFTGNFLQFEGNNIAAEAVRVNGNITGSGGLRAAFGAYTILNGNNSYTGGTAVGTSVVAGTTVTVDRETWEVGSNTAFGGPTSPVYFHAASPGTNVPVLAANVIAGGAPRTLANPLVNAANGLLRFQGTHALTFSGPLDLNGNANIEVGTTGGVTLSGAIGRGSLIKDGAGTMTLTNGANPYTGLTVIKAGVLSVSTVANGGVASDLGAAPAGVSAGSSSPYLVLTGGTLRHTGPSASTDRRFGISGNGGTIDASGSGPLSFTSALSHPVDNSSYAITTSWNAGSNVINVGVAGAANLAVGGVVTSAVVGAIPAGTTVTEVGPNYVRLSNDTALAGTGAALTVAPIAERVLTLTGPNAGLNTIAGTFTDFVASRLAITKSGPGTWQLAGANAYAGQTRVEAGTLLINNTTGSGTGTGTVSVIGGTLGGTGTITGATTVAAGTLAPGTNGIGTLTVNNSVALAGTYAADVNATTVTSDRIVSTSLNVTGATLVVTFTGTLVGTEEFLLARNVTPNTTGVTGTFAGLPNGQAVGSFGGTPMYVYYDQRLTGAVLTPELGVIILTPVPEPGSVLLVASGIVGAAGWFGRRRRRALDTKSVPNSAGIR